MNLHNRISNYSEIFPKYPPLMATKRWIYGIWIIGSNYKRKYGYYGEYPPTYLKRIYSLFPDCKKVLHLFSGVIDKPPYLNCTTFDINPKLKPDICGDVRDIKDYFKKNEFDLIIADPPYETKDFERYNCEKFNKRLVLKDIQYICKGFLVWLDLILPMYSKKEWNMIGTIGLLTGTNRRIRIVSIFENINRNKLKKQTKSKNILSF